MGAERVYELADKGERFIAFIIDMVIINLIGGIIGAGGANIFMVSGPLGILIGIGYQWYFLTRYNGQTPGKMVMDTRIIKTDGTPITDADAIIRAIGYLVNWLSMTVGFWWAFIDKNNQGWHDKLANTYVIKMSEEEKAKRKPTA